MIWPSTPQFPISIIGPAPSTPPAPEGSVTPISAGWAVVLNFKHRLVRETATLPTISVRFGTIFPTGHFSSLNSALLETDLIGSGSYAFTPGLNLSKWLKPFIVYANFYCTMQTTHTTDTGREYPRDYLAVNLAAEYLFTRTWIGCLELLSYFGAGRLVGHQANVPPSALISLAPELEGLVTEAFSPSCGVSIDLTGKGATGEITPLLSMCYVF